MSGGGVDIPTAAELGTRFRAVDIGARLGRYEIREELGSGGMATVYRARDTELRRDVALKVLFPHLSKRRDVVARFHREARAAAALDHPSIVRVYDTGGGDASATTTGGGTGGEAGPRLADPPYLVMELVEGRSLDQVVAQHAPFLAEITACIGMLLGSALAEAHRAGIVHRDVKPANAMVTDRGRVALTDFGVARIEGEDASVVTRSGMLLGTPAFMSPEQAAGDKLDERSDIYSLGATLYQLATGAQPYSGSTPRVMAAIVEHKLVPPLQRNPTMGTELARIIERMMAFEPAQRYQRASEAAAALRAVVEHAGMDT
ncbi:MAG TPA: serine/threonine-protein kinase, partial [Haliangium sp.]|nr:serine/threonine-protein kinase [Haliangium sp.]